MLYAHTTLFMITLPTVHFSLLTNSMQIGNVIKHFRGKHLPSNHKHILRHWEHYWMWLEFTSCRQAKIYLTAVTQFILLDNLYPRSHHVKIKQDHSHNQSSREIWCLGANVHAETAH